MLSLPASRSMRPSKIILHYLPQTEKRHINGETSLPRPFTAPVRGKGAHGQGGSDTAGSDAAGLCFWSRRLPHSLRGRNRRCRLCTNPCLTVAPHLPLYLHFQRKPHFQMLLLRLPQKKANEREMPVELTDPLPSAEEARVATIRG